MPLLENQAFLTEFSKLLIAKKESGSIWFTTKQFHEFPAKGGHRKGKDKASRNIEKVKVNENSNVSHSLLFRAKSGSKKLSTVVPPEDVIEF